VTTTPQPKLPNPVRFGVDKGRFLARGEKVYHALVGMHPRNTGIGPMAYRRLKHKCRSRTEAELYGPKVIARLQKGYLDEERRRTEEAREARTLRGRLRRLPAVARETAGKARARIRFGWWDFLAGLASGYDRRPKTTGTTKFAVRRGKGLFLVECPKCHSQHVKPWSGATSMSFPLFGCLQKRCDTWFMVYLEDGMVNIWDARRGNARLPYRAREDPIRGYLSLGQELEAKEWWPAETVYRDLRKDGKDAHGHNEYAVMPTPPETPPTAMQAPVPAAEAGPVIAPAIPREKRRHPVRK